MSNIGANGANMEMPSAEWCGQPRKQGASQGQLANVATNTTIAPQAQISRIIFLLRGHRVILDRDLAALYGVATKRLNEAVKRNAARLPHDFMFQLSATETEVLRSQFATSKSDSMDHRGGARYRPFAFTEHGAIQAANVLNSPHAIAMSIYVVRTFVQLRAVIASNKNLERKLVELEGSLAALDSKTQSQLKGIYSLIRQLMGSPPLKRRGIGFTADLDEG